MAGSELLRADVRKSTDFARCPSLLSISGRRPQGVVGHVKRETIAEISVFVMLVTVGVGMRFVSNSLELWNFTPVTATALFAAYYLSRRSVAMAVPLLVMVLSNIWLPGYGDWRMIVAVYVAAALPVLFRGLLRNRYRLTTIAFCTVGSSLGFFVFTNLAHWGFTYADHTPQTLIACFAAALAFYRDQYSVSGPLVWFAMMAGDLVWSAVFFGNYSLAMRFGVVPAEHAAVKMPTGAGTSPAAR